MLTSILSAVCALALGASAMTSQADTVNVYMINGEKVTNFDGSQLCGKTVSDYKIMTATSTGKGTSSVTKIHMIRTDEKQSGACAMHTATLSGQLSGEVSKVTILGSDADSVSNVSVIPGANGVEVYIDGKKSSEEKMGKLKPEKIASMTVLRAGSKEAAKWTGNKDKNVILIELKK